MATLKRLFSLAVLIATLAAIASPVAGWSNVNGDEAVRLLEAQSNTSGVFAACDGDADGAITLAEQQAALRRFYDAFSRTMDAARQDEVREEHKFTLTMRRFLAADLNDDLRLEERELQEWFLCSIASAEAALSDGDVDLAVEDFILRVRLGVRIRPEDERLRKLAPRGKTKGEKLENCAAPYRRELQASVLDARLRVALRRCSTANQRVALLRSPGRTWTTRYFGPAGAEPQDMRCEVVEAWGSSANYIENDQSIGRNEARGVALSEARAQGALRKWVFACSQRTERVETPAGAFECIRLEASCQGLRSTLWVSREFPLLSVKESNSDGSGSLLVAFKR